MTFSKKIIDGKAIAKDIIENVRLEAKEMKKKPVLAMFLVGTDPSSEIYLQKKQESCKKAGIVSRKISLSEKTTHQELLMEIDKLNSDQDVDAILVQLPLPDHIDERKIIESVDPSKDVDCLHPANFGAFCEYGSKDSSVVPVTALAVSEMLAKANVEIDGKHAVVIGNSNIVGKPVALLLGEQGATVTVCHDKTSSLHLHTKSADILVVAAGKKHLISKKHLKRGAVVVDVGINRENGTIYGDVDFNDVEEVVSLITPVPGGVGPVTVAMLLKNVLRLAQAKQ